jgi:hypothetical protein
MDSNYIAEEKLPPIKRNPWADNFFRPLLITIVIMCFNISVVNLVRVINPAWNGTFFLIGQLIVTVEAIYSHRVLMYYRARHISVFRYRAAEWVMLILLLKLLSFADKPPAYIWANLQAMWWNPMDAINLEFYVMLVLGVLSWLVATETITDFDRLADPYTFRSSYIEPLARIKARYFWGGVLLMVISGLSHVILRLGFSSLADIHRPTIQGIIINVLVYFMLGLVLLSQANIARLTTSWRIHKVDVNPDLVKHWAKYGLIFLGIVTILVFFLPTGYTMGFLESAGLVVEAILGVLVYIVQLIFFLASLPFILLMRLFAGEEVPDESPPPEMMFDPSDVPPPASPIPWLEALRSLIFWLVTLVIIGYLIKMYIIDRPELLASLSRFRPISFVMNLWQQIWQSLRGLARSGLEIISEQVKFTRPQGESPISGRRWNWFGLGKLSARERILYYYLNILKRAEKRKLARKVSETPYEYEPNLELAVPDVEEDVQQVTDVFVRARYSREEFDAAQAEAVKQEWQRIRKALRRSSSSR